MGKVANPEGERWANRWGTSHVTDGNRWMGTSHVIVGIGGWGTGHVPCGNRWWRLVLFLVGLGGWGLAISLMGTGGWGTNVTYGNRQMGG